uniref:Uncharacterized protein n=1 Tax=Lepeophtheirus salmonis TaxID=72036 RepID=A0A0K2TB60_LEPSM
MCKNIPFKSITSMLSGIFSSVSNPDGMTSIPN